MLDNHNDELHTHVLGRLQVLRPLERVLGTPVRERAGVDGSGVVVGVFNINDERRRQMCSGVLHRHVVMENR